MFSEKQTVINQKRDFLDTHLSLHTLKKHQLQQFLLKICDVGLQKYRPYFEVDDAYDKAGYLSYIHDVRDTLYREIYSKDLTLHGILQLHTAVMAPIRSHERIEHIGALRKIPIITKEKTYKTGLTGYFIPFQQVEKTTKREIQFFNAHINSTAEPLFYITKLHVNFLSKIHLFENGNGRCMFMLLDALLLKYDYFPIFIRQHEEKWDAVSESFIVHNDIERLQHDLYQMIIEIYSDYQIQ